jgi:hypothetical protein
MQIERNDLIKGIARGFERTAVHFGAPPEHQREEIEYVLRRVFERWPGEVHPRFVQMFAELATVAIAARAQYHEPGLSEDDFRRFLETSIDFFNSFTHR